MACKNMFPKGAGFGFICSDIGHKNKSDTFYNEEQKKDVKKYKYEFIKMIKKYTKCDSYGAYHEVIAHIENVGLSELNLNDPFEDVEECVSYWD
ncbi:MAG: hypothetical protein HRT41_02140 [Campylobacteraceae bacterium]|nr:hypothetical protein [Campylobacteraceae bacterium]